MSVAAGVTSEQFRHVIGHFVTGVTVVTTERDGEPLGTTASAIASLSLDPPMLIACMNRGSATGQAIRATRRFAVNVLGIGQDDLAVRFGRKGGDKFDGVRVRAGIHDQPLLSEALAHVECRVVEEAEGGTHLIFIAEVEGAVAGQGAPLAYYRGQFGLLDISDESKGS